MSRVYTIARIDTLKSGLRFSELNQVTNTIVYYNMDEDEQVRFLEFYVAFRKTYFLRRLILLLILFVLGYLFHFYFNHPKICLGITKVYLFHPILLLFFVVGIWLALSSAWVMNIHESRDPDKKFSRLRLYISCLGLFVHRPKGGRSGFNADRLAQMTGFTRKSGHALRKIRGTWKFIAARSPIYQKQSIE